MTSHITHPAQGLIPRRTTPRPPVGVCNELPLGAKLSTMPDEARCLEPRWHYPTTPHRNRRGDVWPEVVMRAIDRVPERRAVGR